MSISHEAHKALPRLPHLEHLKHQARALQRATQRRDAAALARVAAHHPRSEQRASGSRAISLGDAQLVIAREYGFSSWARLKAHVEAARLSLPVTVTLPVLRVAPVHLVPGATFLLPISDADRSALELALAERAPVLCLREGVEPGNAAAERGVIGWPAARALRESRKRHVRLCVGARARVLSLRTEGEVLLGDAEPEPEFAWSPVAKLDAVARLHDVLERASHRIVWLSRPELSRLRAEGDSSALLGLALRQLDPADLSRCSELSDPPEVIDLVCRALERRVRASALPDRPSPVSENRGEPSASLVVLRSEAHPHVCGKRLDLRSVVTRIGRGDGCELDLYSDSVSRVHARIEREGEGYVLTDAGSTNGTFSFGEPEPLSKKPLRDGDRFVVGDAILCFLSGGDLEQKYEALVDELAREDPLTRLPNRERWLDELRRRVLAARGRSAALAAIVLDIDALGALDDRLGHLAGDRVIREVASTLREVAGEDTIYRYGGGAFCLTVSGRAEESAVALAEHLRRAVGARGITVEGEDVRVTVSAGVASLEATLGPEELFERARSALRQAKAEGGDRTALCPDR